MQDELPSDGNEKDTLEYELFRECGVAAPPLGGIFPSTRPPPTLFPSPLPPPPVFSMSNQSNVPSENKKKRKKKKAPIAKKKKGRKSTSSEDLEGMPSDAPTPMLNTTSKVSKKTKTKLPPPKLVVPTSKVSKKSKTKQPSSLPSNKNNSNSRPPKSSGAATTNRRSKRLANLNRKHSEVCTMLFF